MKSGIKPRKKEEDEDRTGGGGGGRMREKQRGGGWRRRTWRDMYMKYVLFSDTLNNSKLQTVEYPTVKKGLYIRYYQVIILS